MTVQSDLLIVGGGPAGLSAAINAASEGLTVHLLDDGIQLGGQAKESNAIENYPGFPDGITGNQLMSNMVRQAIKFNTNLIVPQRALQLHKEKRAFWIITEDYEQYAAKCILIATGLSYRRHQANGISQMMGRGVYYGMPYGLQIPNNHCVIVVGGANSAGQAAVKLSKNPKIRVLMLVRKRLEDQMSTYLIDRIKGASNIDVYENTEVDKVFEKNGKLCAVSTPNSGTIACNHLFIFIGAMPRTLWLNGTLEMDEKKFIIADGFKTSVPGVLAAGDVRSGSIKRISASVGEGSAAVNICHQYLNNVI